MISDNHTSDAVVFHVVPDKLIGIEFGTIRRQDEQFEPILYGFNEAFRLFCTMRRVSIDN
jgi:hypothetical protein